MLPRIFSVAIFASTSLSVVLSSQAAFAANVTLKNPQQAIAQNVKIQQIASQASQEVMIPADGIHVVKDGETLFGIARMYGVTYANIADINTINQDGSIRAGQKIKIPRNAVGTMMVKNLAVTDQNQPKPAAPLKDIPSNGIHVVAYGETIFGIARAYGISPIDFATENEFELTHVIKIGDKLKVPKKSEVSAATPALQSKKEEVKTPVVEKETPLFPVIKKEAHKGCELDFSWPISSKKVIKKYGELLKTGAKSDGVIIQSDIAKPVLASFAGEVVYAGSDISEYGNLMIIKHKDNWMTIYGYMRSFSKKVGDKIAKGEEIGKTGDTGDATEPSMYFSIRRVKTPHNPELCI